MASRVEPPPPSSPHLTLVASAAAAPVPLFPPRDAMAAPQVGPVGEAFAPAQIPVNYGSAVGGAIEGTTILYTSFESRIRAEQTALESRIRVEQDAIESRIRADHNDYRDDVRDLRTELGKLRDQGVADLKAFRDGLVVGRRWLIGLGIPLGLAGFPLIWSLVGMAEEIRGLSATTARQETEINRLRDRMDRGDAREARSTN